MEKRVYLLDSRDGTILKEEKVSPVHTILEYVDKVDYAEDCEPIQKNQNSYYDNRFCVICEGGDKYHVLLSSNSRSVGSSTSNFKVRGYVR